MSSRFRRMPGSFSIRWSGPEVDSVEGLSPSIAIEQKTTTRSPRSTVGTITEIYDYLRVVYSAIGTPHCPNCGQAIARQSTEQIVQAVTALKPDERIMVLAPVVRGRKGEYKKELEKYAKEGYLRARIDGELVSLDEPVPLDRRKNHTIEIVVDRLLLKSGITQRLEQSIETALKLAGGLGYDFCSGRRRARLFGKAGVSRLRHFGSATGTAFVQLQFAIRRLSGMPRARIEIRFRSGKDDCGLEQAAF